MTVLCWFLPPIFIALCVVLYFGMGLHKPDDTRFH